MWHTPNPQTQVSFRRERTKDMTWRPADDDKTEELATHNAVKTLQNGVKMKNGEIHWSMDNSALTPDHVGTWLVEIGDQYEDTQLASFELVISPGCHLLETPLQQQPEDAYLWPAEGHEWARLDSSTLTWTSTSDSFTEEYCQELTGLHPQSVISVAKSGANNSSSARIGENIVTWSPESPEVFKIDPEAIKMDQKSSKSDDFEVSSFFKYGEFYLSALQAPLTIVNCQDLVEMEQTTTKQTTGPQQDKVSTTGVLPEPSNQSASYGEQRGFDGHLLPAPEVVDLMAETESLARISPSSLQKCKKYLKSQSTKVNIPESGLNECGSECPTLSSTKSDEVTCSGEACPTKDGEIQQPRKTTKRKLQTCDTLTVSHVSVTVSVAATEATLGTVDQGAGCTNHMIFEQVDPVPPTATLYMEDQDNLQTLPADNLSSMQPVVKLGGPASPESITFTVELVDSDTLASLDTVTVSVYVDISGSDLIVTTWEFRILAAGPC